MLHELADESGIKGVKMNKSETMVKTDIDTPIYVNNTQSEIEIVESYIFVGHNYSTRVQNSQDKEVQRRLTTGLPAFAKHQAMLCGADTWAVTTIPWNTQAAAKQR